MSLDREVVLLNCNITEPERYFIFKIVLGKFFKNWNLCIIKIVVETIMKERTICIIYNLCFTI